MGPIATMAAGALGVLALLWAVAEARAARSRWGVVRSRLSQRGEGAFRSAAVTEAHARSVPGAVRIAGPMGIVVGLTAPLVCVPMVLGLMWRAFTELYQVPLALWCSVLSAVLLTAQCLFLVRAARVVLRCERGAGDTAVLTGKLGIVAQMLALLGWVIAGTGSNPTLHVAMLLSVLLTLANLMLLRAGDAVTQVQSQMTHDEWYALPGSHE